MAIPVISTIIPKNDGDFPVAAAEHISYKDGRLPDYLPVAVTQAEYDALAEAGEINENTPYLIIEGDGG